MTTTVPLRIDLQPAQSTHLRRVRKLLRLLRRPAYRPALRYGVGAGIEHEAVPFDEPFATVIDVGANAGQFGLFAAANFPDAALVCFEPLPGPRSKLIKVLGGHQRLSVSHIAAGATAGHGCFHVSRSSASSSLLAPTAAMATVFPGTDEQAVVEVETQRLDDAMIGELARPALLKIDVQGAELDVLRGAEELLHQIDQIYVECSFFELYEGQALLDDVVVHLKQRGFTLRGMFALARDRQGHCLQADCLFSRHD